MAKLAYGWCRFMLTTVVVVVIVSGSLFIGAAWGIFGSLPEKLDGFLVAAAGGALLLSVTSELIAPSIEKSSVLVASLAVLGGALVFTVVDRLIEEKWGSGSGGGLLAAITLDGVPENLALGVALIGAGFGEVAALAGSILLSNLPEAAAGAREMAAKGRTKGRVLAIWAATATMLSAAAIVGYVFMDGASQTHLAAIRCLAAGAVIASLATEVFPKAYAEDHNWAGVATAIGAVFAFALGELGAP